MTLKDEHHELIGEDVKCFEWYLKEEARTEGKS